MTDTTAVDVAGAAVGFPGWALWFAFSASLVLSVLQVIQIGRALSKKANVEVRITREAFCRLLPGLGECVYLNIVCLARSGTALIEDISAVLERTSGSSKSYSLAFQQLGAKRESPDGSVNYYFHSPSPLFYLSEGTPYHLAWIFNIEEYAERIKAAYNNHQSKIGELRDSLAADFKDNATQEDWDDLQTKISDVVKGAAEIINEHIQVEAGEYRIEICVRYSQKFLWRRLQQTSNAILRFEISGDNRTVFKAMIPTSLQLLSAKFVFPQENTPNISAPEITFVKVSE